MLMHLLLVALSCVVAAQSAVADCLEVSEQRFEPQNTELGGLALQWEAEIENRCDASFDADLTVHFRNAAGESVYRVLDWTKVRAHEARTIGKRVHVPSYHADSIAEIDVETKELKRPF